MLNDEKPDEAISGPRGGLDMSVWGWQGESATRVGPPRHLRLPFMAVAILLPLMLVDPRQLALWGGGLVLWSGVMVGPGVLLRWMRIWLPISLLYGLLLWGFAAAAEPVEIAVLIGRVLLAVLGMQLLTWSVPPSDVVATFEWVLPRLGVSLAIALRLLPRLERSAAWRHATLKERDFVTDGGRMKRLSLAARVWPGWVADALDHAHDLGDAVQARGILTPVNGDKGLFARTSGWLLEDEEKRRTAAAEAPFSKSVQLGLDLELRLPDGRSLGRHSRIIPGGSIVHIRGPSGAGKSSLVRVLAGVSPWQHPITVHGRAHLAGHPLHGEIDLAEGPFDEPVACWIPQDPDRHGLGESVRREFQISRRTRGGLSQTTMLETLRKWGLFERLDARPENLSSGEAQRLLLAAHLDRAEPIWLLDEADAHLDEAGFILLGKAVMRHKLRGGIVFVIAHREARWHPMADITIDVGKSEPVLDLPPSKAPAEGPADTFTPPPIHLFKSEVEPVAAGELILVQGDNGTGKTTLLREWAEHAGLPWLPCDPDRRLLGMTLAEELAFSHPLLHAASMLDEGVDPGAEAHVMQAEQARFLEQLGLSDLPGHTPVHDLSCGERRRLSMLPLLLRAPPLLLLDEIDRALDDEALADLLRLLDELRSEGVAIVITTHTPDLATWARVSEGRLWQIEAGVMTEVVF